MLAAALRRGLTMISEVDSCHQLPISCKRFMQTIHANRLQRLRLSVNTVLHCIALSCIALHCSYAIQAVQSLQIGVR